MNSSLNGMTTASTNLKKVHLTLTASGPRGMMIPSKATELLLITVTIRNTPMKKGSAFQNIGKI